MNCLETLMLPQLANVMARKSNNESMVRQQLPAPDYSLLLQSL